MPATDPDPSTEHLTPIGGRDLRFAVLLVLHRRRMQTLTIAQILEDLAELGARPDSGHPAKGLSDAMRWEVKRGRARRAGWGRYRLGYLPETTRWRARHMVRDVIARGANQRGGSDETVAMGT